MKARYEISYPAQGQGPESLQNKEVYQESLTFTDTQCHLFNLDRDQLEELIRHPEVMTVEIAELNTLGYSHKEIIKNILKIICTGKSLSINGVSISAENYEFISLLSKSDKTIKKLILNEKDQIKKQIGLEASCSGRKSQMTDKHHGLMKEFIQEQLTLAEMHQQFVKASLEISKPTILRLKRKVIGENNE